MGENELLADRTELVADEELDWAEVVAMVIDELDGCEASEEGTDFYVNISWEKIVLDDSQKYSSVSSSEE